MSKILQQQDATGLEIAVIGMASRFPGANNIIEFWENLKNGIETISFYSDQELIEVGIDPLELNNPNYIKARGLLKNVENFDSEFFAYTPLESEIMDPQIRLFHQYSWEALEDAGYDPGAYNGLIGLYAGAKSSFHWEAQTMMSGRTTMLGEMDSANLNDKDYLSQRICYKLNLKGPGYTIQTACSTSLAAIHLACQGLLSAECDMALAGGVSISYMMRYGYHYQEGMICSPDGHCRTFDAKANGTIFGDGIGVVVLKRLQNAAADRDHIYAVIKGSAVNNDGTNKIGFTAPGIEGQAEVIMAALEMAEVDPEAIGFIETHGTATTLGDPIEIEALTRAFATKKRGYCAVGSVKSNVGHLNTAAGIVGFIKAVLAIKYKLIPPSLHFTTPNPKIDFENTPFYVNTKPCKWENKTHPLRGGVSSFGIGGTNAHVVLEEAPPLEPSSPGREYQLFLLSAKTSSALDLMTANLGHFLEKHKDINPADAAYTLQQGRRYFQYRRMLVCRDVEEAIGILSSPGSPDLRSAAVKDQDINVVFMFPGQGAQYVNMGWDLYRTEPVFREEMDRCFDILKPLMDYDIKDALYPANRSYTSNRSNNTHKSYRSDINQTEIAQPLLFVFEYALAQLLMKWGIKPYAMIGHSIGEYTAACLSGVFSLEDALKLVVLRGRLMQQMPGGAMMSVPLAEDQLKPLLQENKELSLAAVNASLLCVISGPQQAVEDFGGRLKEQGHDCRRLHTSHAFHSKMMEPILYEFEQQVTGMQLNKPQIPYISNLTGKGITSKEALNPGYWSKHLRCTVRFYDGLTELFKIGKSILVEVGPGTSLSTFVNQHPGKSSEQKVVNLIRHPRENTTDNYFLLSKIGQLWLYGKKIDWTGFYLGETRSRIPLPAYPFEGKRFWMERNVINQEAKKPDANRLRKKPDAADWFYIPQWTRSLLPADDGHDISRWLVFMDKYGLGTRLVKRLTSAHHEMVIVEQGSRFHRVTDREFVLDPRQPGDYQTLFAELRKLNKIPQGIIHLWGITRDRSDGSNEADTDIDGLLDRGFYSLLHMVQALGNQEITKRIRVAVVTNGMQEVTGAEKLCPGKSTVLGAVKVIPQEYPLIDCRSIDIEFLPPAAPEESLLDRLVMELSVESPHRVVCWRARHRWVQTFEPVRMKKPRHVPRPLKESGVYLVTGGLGGIGLELAQYLARTVRARLILIGRSHFPLRDRWQEWLENHPAEDSISGKIRKIQVLEKLGAEVLVLSADVNAREQMQKVIDATLKRFGRINGVIHAAGVPGGGVMQLKNRETAERVLAPKVKGTLVLDEILGDVKPDFIMLCSSLISISTPVGQSDYAAANAFLDAYAYYKTIKDGIFTVSINWDAWSETGMALEALKRSQRSENEVKTPEVKIPGAKIPAQGIHSGIFRVHEQWILAEHTLKGKGLVPGTAYLEMAAAAFEEYTGTGAIQIENVYFRAPLLIDAEEEKEVRTILEKQGDAFEFKIQTRINTVNPEREEWQDHAVGRIAAVTRGPSKKYDLKKIRERCQNEEIVIPQYETGSSNESLGVRYGPRWNNKKWIRFGETEALALLELPEEFVTDLESFKLHPALMDMATSFPLMKLKSQSPYYPFSYKKIRISHWLPAKIFGYFRGLKLNQSGEESITFDISILDEQGSQLVEIEGFTLLKFSSDRIKRAFVETSPDEGAQKDSGVNGKGLFSGGLLSAEGVDAFTRVLEASMPQVVVSTRDLLALLDRHNLPDTSSPADEVTPAAALPGTHQRPQLSTPYAPPRSPVEKAIVEIWQKFFGIKPVGIHDDFFELGGDSLKVNTVASHLHKELAVGIPLGEFFNRPTIAKLAEYINSAEKTTFLSIEPVEKREYYSLSSAQKRLYIIQQMTPQSTAYNTPLTVELEGQADRDRLNQAFQKLIERHESMKTSFKLIKGQPVQAVHNNVEFEVDYYDSVTKFIGDTGGKDSQLQNINYQQITNKKETSSHHVSDKSIVHHFIRPFDLAAAPLLRVGLIKVTRQRQRYLLIIDIHHIISDRMGTGVLVKDFLSLYSREELPPLKIQYRDYSQWKNKALEEKAIKKQEEYWCRMFDGEIPLLNLPFDYNRPVVQSYEGKIIKFEIGEEETTAIKRLLLDEEVTLFIFILSIYDVFLSRLSGQEDIVVGTPTGGRNHPDLDPLIGVFINTLALRNSCGGHKSFVSFLKEVKGRVLDAFDNQDYPFEDLVERIVVNRDLSRNPLFDIMFILFNEWDVEETTEKETTDTIIRPVEFEKSTSQVDLTLIAMEKESHLYFRFEYCTKLFKDETIQRFINYFKALVSSVLKNPNQHLFAIEIIPGEEKNRLLHEFNNTGTDYARDKTIHRLFAEQVEKTPDNTSLVGRLPGSPGMAGEKQVKEDTAGTQFIASVSYKELNKKSDQLAAVLREKGVKPGTIVGLLVERTPVLMTGLLGILKTGGTYLPMDPEYPQERIKYILQKSGAVLLLTHREVMEKIDTLGLELEMVDILDQGLYTGTPTQQKISQDKNRSRDKAIPADPAYVIYTSGSTGNPKGVVIRHQNVVNFIKGMTASIPFCPGKTILALTTISFDIFFLEMLLPLTCGMIVTMADEAQQRDPHLIASGIITHNVNILQVTPSRLQLLSSLNDGLQCLARVEVLIVGGEAFPPNLFKRVSKGYQGKIYNVYGPTETTIWSTVKDLNASGDEGLTIGTPTANTQVYIVDRHQRHQPLGTAGELLIGGDGVAAGYLNNIELTAEKFDHDLWDSQDEKKNYKLQITKKTAHELHELTRIKITPNKKFLQGGSGGAVFSKSAPPGRRRQKVYKTGDLARWLSCGEIEFLGRIDHQVKVRGFRIELEEIEEQLMKHEYIKEAVVISRANKTGDNYLAAYFVPVPGADKEKFEIDELRTHLSQKLPDYMIPSYFVPLEKMPLTPNKKVARNALPEVGTSQDKLGFTYIEPTGPLEKKIAAIWKEELGLEKIGANDNFFGIGGNSLDAVRISNRLKEIFDKNIPVVAMFRYRTISSFARYLSRENGGILSKSDRSEVLERGERDKLKRLQMRKRRSADGKN